MRLLGILSDSDAPTEEIVKLIQTDPAITAKILKVANSPLYGGGRRVDSLDLAVLLMGRNSIACLALSFSLSETARQGGALNRYYREYWRRSVIHALAMECLARHVDHSSCSAWFVAGLLMDIGQLTLLQSDASRYAALLDASRVGSSSLVELEQNELGTTHTEIAATLLTDWSLPEAVVAVAKYHELAPDETVRGREREYFAQIVGATVAVATADFLCGATPMESFRRLAFLFSSVCGLPERQLQEYLDGVNERLRAMSDLLSADVSDLPSTAELLACATEQLSALALQSLVPFGAGGERTTVSTNDICELRARLYELEQASCLDALTGLYDRAYFDLRLRQRLRHLETHPVALGILLGDLDKFKRINDTYGHEAGDEVLRAAARVMQLCVRSTDVVARYGGEEFVILADAPDRECLHELAERIRHRLADTTVRFGKHDIKLTISLGGVFVGAVPPRQHATNPANLVAMADKSMYESKWRGGDAVSIAVVGSRGAGDVSPDGGPKSLVPSAALTQGCSR
jgi:diguanylate cyclase (GGDEF)-like protein